MRAADYFVQMVSDRLSSLFSLHHSEQQSVCCGWRQKRLKEDGPFNACGVGQTADIYSDHALPYSSYFLQAIAALPFLLGQHTMRLR